MKHQVLVRKPSGSKYHVNVPVDAYILAKMGMGDTQISQIFGVTDLTFSKWKDQQPALIYALEKAREKDVNKRPTFLSYVYKHLSPEVRALWERINYWEDAANGYEKIEAMLANEGEDVRMSLWFHAFVDSNFNASEACRKVCVSKTTLAEWKENNPQFPKLIDEMEWHKNNLFEDSLISLVKAGNPLAVLFANKTRNRDRGYDSKITVQHEGTITHLHKHIVQVDRLDLSLEEKRRLLEAVRAQKALPENQDEIIDIEEGVEVAAKPRERSAFYDDEETE